MQRKSRGTSLIRGNKLSNNSREEGSAQCISSQIKMRRCRSCFGNEPALPHARFAKDAANSAATVFQGMKCSVDSIKLRVATDQICSQAFDSTARLDGCFCPNQTMNLSRGFFSFQS